MFRFEFKRLQFLCISVMTVLYAQEEPKCPKTYIEERLLEKVIEIDFKIQAAFKILEKMDERVSEKNEVSVGNREVTQLPKSLLESPVVLTTSALETGGWQLIFRAASGNGQNVYDAWTTGQGTSENKPTRMERSYVPHYRSKAVKEWSNLDVKYVKFGLYDQTHEVASVTFNGMGCNMNDWFDKSRIIHSTWSDLTMFHEFNVFSIAGFIRSGSLDRRFHINTHYGGCDKDVGHIAVIDTKTRQACLWDQHPVYPQFLYSKINAADNWNRIQFGRADFIAVFTRS